MSYTISKDFAWSASHVLDGLPDGHQCGRLHGHNYVARVILTSDTLDATGFVVDYGELGFVKDFIDNTWDHRHLNDAVPFTTMNDGFMAVALHGACDGVRVMMSAVGCTLEPRMRA